MRLFEKFNGLLLNPVTFKVRPEKSLRVVLRGGVGNQLFQYFAGLDYATKHGSGVKLDATHVARGMTNREFLLPNVLKAFFDVPSYEIHIPKYGGLGAKWNSIITLNSPVSRLFRPNQHTSQVIGFDEALLNKNNLTSLVGYHQTYLHVDNLLRNHKITFLETKARTPWVLDLSLIHI